MRTFIPEERRCEQCNEPYLAKWDRQRFCKVKCRNMWHEAQTIRIPVADYSAMQAELAELRTKVKAKKKGVAS